MLVYQRVSHPTSMVKKLVQGKQLKAGTCVVSSSPQAPPPVKKKRLSILLICMKGLSLVHKDQDVPFIYIWFEMIIICNYKYIYSLIPNLFKHILSPFLSCRTSNIF